MTNAWHMPLEKQMAVMLKFCVAFPKGHNFPCEETEVDIEQAQTAHCGAGGVCEGLLCTSKFEEKKIQAMYMAPNQASYRK